MIQKRYELMPTSRFTPSGRLLYQVRALVDFRDVRAGDLGGFIEGEHNLPHDSEVWLFGCATLYGDGYISERDLFLESDVMVPDLPIRPSRPGPRAGTPRDYSVLH